MTVLWIFPESGDPAAARVERSDRAIAEALAAVGIRYEHGPLPPLPLAPDAPPEAVLAAFEPQVTRLRETFAYQSVDVARMARSAADGDWPAKAEAARGKFLNEHTHAEDEVRLFAFGRGLFYLRSGGAVYAVLCEAGDLLSVPAGTRHWFDMGKDPHFCAIRFFGTPDGWVGHFTGDPIASRFPSFDTLVEQAGQGRPAEGTS